MDDDELGESSSSPPLSMEKVKEELEYLKDVPKAIIFTNLPSSMFDKDSQNTIKSEFESTLQKYDSNIKVAYLPNFRRARVEFTSGSVAALVKYELHKSHLRGNEIKAFFVQTPSLYSTSDKSTLNPPKLEKQFLISPPASPPVGWEPITEHEPIINYDLVQAMLVLGPEGGSHELHSGCEAKNIPKIVIHLTPDDSSIDPSKASNVPIKQTKRPPM